MRRIHLIRGGAFEHDRRSRVVGDFHPPGSQGIFLPHHDLFALFRRRGGTGPAAVSHTCNLGNLQRAGDLRLDIPLDRLRAVYGHDDNSVFATRAIPHSGRKHSCAKDQCDNKVGNEHAASQRRRMKDEATNDE